LLSFFRENASCSAVFFGFQSTLHTDSVFAGFFHM
jgi:hypothetical protein